MFSNDDGGPMHPLGMPGGPQLPITATISPYLDIDPSIFKQSEPQYILPQGAPSKRGRFELAFSQIGTAVIGGCAFGGARGFYVALKEPILIEQGRRAQLVNGVVKYGGATARPLGCLALIFHGFGVLLGWGRGVDDGLNSAAAGALTGALFRAHHGLRPVGIYAVAGTVLGGVYGYFFHQRMQEKAFRSGY